MGIMTHFIMETCGKRKFFVSKRARFCGLFALWFSSAGAGAGTVNLDLIKSMILFF